ncbi:MAG: c-type cytochrome [Gammaproteobacteria bacterium]|nr:c-type cytochrome [Gammaproteobacteria bacterium]
MKLILFLCLIVLSDYVCAGQANVGERIYETGIQGDGKYVTATVQSDIVVNGRQLACVSCHKTSLKGSAEGTVVVPPLTYEWLMNGKVLSLAERRGVSAQGAKAHVSYTDDLLKRAILQGVAADGRRLDPAMPKYRLNQAELADLIAYIKSQHDRVPDGVDSKEIQIATIIAGDVDPAKKRDMLKIMETFLQQKNADIRQETQRALHTPWTREWWYKSYRKVRLHVWTLNGDSSSWTAQLSRLYSETPVFAVVSGLGRDWHIVDAFCEERGLPCILPNTDSSYLAPSEGFSYALHFNGGLPVEEDVLTKYLRDQGDVDCVTILSDEGESFRHSAGRIRDKLKAIGVDARLESFRDAKTLRRKCANVVAWTADTEAVRLVAKQANKGHLYISSTLIRKYDDVIDTPCRCTYHVVSPYQIGNIPVTNARSFSWFKTYLGEVAYPDLSLDTLYAIKLATGAIVGMRSNFSREYFLERIEHMVDKSLMRPAYDHISLGPNQRTLSNGAYVLSMDAETQKLTRGPWISR